MTESVLRNKIAELGISTSHPGFKACALVSSFHFNRIYSVALEFIQKKCLKSLNYFPGLDQFWRHNFTRFKGLPRHESRCHSEVYTR